MVAVEIYLTCEAADHAWNVCNTRLRDKLNNHIREVFVVGLEFINNLGYLISDELDV